MSLLCEGHGKKAEQNNFLVSTKKNELRASRPFEKCPHPLQGNSLPMTFNGVFPFSFLREGAGKPQGFSIQYLETFADKFDFPKKFVLTVGAALVG